MNGANLLLVEIGLKEIRTVESLYATSQRIKNPKTIDATAIKDSGKTQAKAPVQSALSAIKDKAQSWTAKSLNWIAGQ